MYVNELDEGNYGGKDTHSNNSYATDNGINGDDGDNTTITTNKNTASYSKSITTYNSSAYIN